ncbi:fimbrial protein [Variovorax sp. GT1P44]|uniref:fimbrial protein n=1 Tax=Variovorax sp. GT1P44 TaxID=3443742 RepID=UPI003F453E0F
MCLLHGAPAAWAACARIPGVTELVINIDIGNVLVSPGIPVGGLIMSREFPIQTNGSADIRSNCSGSGGRMNAVMLQGAPVPSRADIYSTDVPGVGIRLSLKTSTLRYYPFTRQTGVGNLYFELGSQFRVELIKTAPITGNGPLAHGVYTRFYGDDGPAYSILTTVLSGAGINIVTPSCTVDAGTRNIPVQFGKVPISSFKGMASPAIGYEKNFNIRLNCSAGLNMPNTVYLRMDAQRDPTNLPGVLQITQGGKDIAGGVGIQVLDKMGLPVQFGDDGLVGLSKDGVYLLPYTARYFQTGNQVTAGRADGMATFTLDYK